MAECRDCGRALDGEDGYFEVCNDHDLECIVPAVASLEIADVAIVALHWATRRAVGKIVGEIGDG